MTHIFINAVISSLTDDAYFQTIGALTENTGLSRNTVKTVMKTLHKDGTVRRDERGAWILTSRIASFPDAMRLVSRPR